MFLKNSPSIFWASALLLFAELVFIRWLPSEIHILGFFKNMVLIVGFLGVGLGMVSSRKPARMTLSLWACAAVVYLAAGPLGELSLAREASSNITIDFLVWPTGAGWSGPKASASAILLWHKIGLVYTAVVLSALMAVFIPLGRLLGKALAQAPRPLLAYGWNLAGSLVGVWLLSILSFLSLAPILWFFILWLGYLPLYDILSQPARLSRGAPALDLRKPSAEPESDFAGPGRAHRPHILYWVLSGALMLGVLSLKDPPSDGERVSERWSIYQRLILSRHLYENKIPYHSLETNGAFFQYLLDLSSSTLAGHPKLFGVKDTRYDYYELPYRLSGPEPRVLILGAGAGNDAAAALRSGVKEVDAVEIDPWIIRFGRRFHPENPYGDRRVRVHENDARAFLSKSTATYDLIVLSLLDAHTSASEALAVNLDFYVYTLESFQQIRKRLSPEGILFLAFQVPSAVHGAALIRTLQEAFPPGPWALTIRQPFIRGPSSQTVFVCSNNPENLRRLIRQDGRLAASFSREPLSTRDAPILTDNWPYLYVGKRHIPRQHLWMGGLLLAIFLLFALLNRVKLKFETARQGRGSPEATSSYRGGSPYLESFFLGAGFLLMETYLLSRLFLLYGSTWWVNVGTISGVLIMNLFANLLILKGRMPSRGFAYGLLGALLVSQLVVSPQIFLGSVSKTFFATAYYCLPFFFSGLLFSRAMRGARSANGFLGMNLLGAAAGGLLSAAVFITGFRGIVILCLAGYFLACIIGGLHRRFSLTNQ